MAAACGLRPAASSISRRHPATVSFPKSSTIITRLHAHRPEIPTGQGKRHLGCARPAAGRRPTHRPRRAGGIDDRHLAMCVYVIPIGSVEHFDSERRYWRMDRSREETAGRLRASCCCYLVSSVRSFASSSVASARSASFPLPFAWVVPCACLLGFDARPACSYIARTRRWVGEGGSEGTPGVEELNREKEWQKGGRYG